MNIISKLEQYLTENYILPTKKSVSAPKTVSAPEKKQETPNPIHSLYSKIAPSLSLQPPPSDEQAHKIKQSWKDKTEFPDIPIFIDPSFGNHFPFLSNIASAINSRFAPSRIYDITSIEKEDRWKTTLQESPIKFLLIPDLLLRKSPRLLTHYREIPGELIKRILHIPLIVLQDLDAYYTTPLLKSTLWNLLLQHLSLLSMRP